MSEEGMTLFILTQAAGGGGEGTFQSVPRGSVVLIRVIANRFVSIGKTGKGAVNWSESRSTLIVSFPTI